MSLDSTQVVLAAHERRGVTIQEQAARIAELEAALRSAQAIAWDADCIEEARMRIDAVLEDACPNG